MDLVLPILIIYFILCWRVSPHVIQADTIRITCWTCPSKTHNMECNDWAPEKFCPIGLSVCQTVHSLHTRKGESIRVDKRCVSPEMCQLETVGCTFDQTKKSKTCISCCSTPYCNEEVAHDNQTAIRLSITVMESRGYNEVLHWSMLVMLILANVILL